MSDLIERDKAMKVAMWFGTSEQKYHQSFIKKRVMEIPSARPKGEWIAIWREDGTSDSAYCGECHRVNQRPLGDFCKWCGADMREREGE